MPKDKITKQDLFFAYTYFFTLALTAFALVFNLLNGDSIIFYLPFVIGSGGSLLLYVLLNRVKSDSPKTTESKIQSRVICHAFCSAVYIIGAFILLVFYNLDFAFAWLYYMWIIPILMVAALRPKHNALIFVLSLAIFAILFVLNIDGLLGATVRAMAMGGFWGISFYFLLGFWSDIRKLNLNELGNG